MSKVALVIGVTGQDGSFLAELLLSKGYMVHGMVRRASTFNTGRIDHIFLDDIVRDMRMERKFILHYGDITDSSSIMRIIQSVQPDEIYNLSGQSHTKVSFFTPEYTSEVSAIGPLRLLEAVKILGLTEKTRVYQASTSELFGRCKVYPQNEDTPFAPCSPHAVSKQFSYWMTRNYRESFGMFAVNGITFNHESERRGENFVTRKVSLAVARIANDLTDKLYLGNLSAERDWGYAKDYVECMWRMLQTDKPEDYVIATGRSNSVRDLCKIAFSEIGINLEFEGDGLDEIGYEKSTGKVYIEVDPMYFRPLETGRLVGDPSKAKAQLGWNPEKTSFEDLIRIMVRHDLDYIGSSVK